MTTKVVFQSFISCVLFLTQEVIDIFEGVRDDQAVRMASNLGFKGPLERQVLLSAGTHSHAYAYKCTLKHNRYSRKKAELWATANASDLDAHSRMSFY